MVGRYGLIQTLSRLEFTSSALCGACKCVKSGDFRNQLITTVPFPIFDHEGLLSMHTRAGQGLETSQLLSDDDLPFIKPYKNGQIDSFCFDSVHLPCVIPILSAWIRRISK